MMKKDLAVFGMFSLIIICFSIANASAAIYFSNFDSVYNLGDTINVEVKVDPVLSEYLLKIDLFCNDKIMIPFNLMPDSEGKVSIKLPLNYNTIKEISGNCYFSGEYAGEIIKSRRFEISDKLDISMFVESFFIKPGENLTIKGNVRRQNGIGINGDIQITIPVLKLTNIIDAQINNSENQVENATFINETEVNVDNGIFYGKIVNGEFSAEFNLAKETPAGDYRMDILAYEKSASGIKISGGSAVASLKVFQVLTSIDIALTDQNSDPGKEISFKPQLFDQTGNLMSDEVSIMIKNQDSETIFEKIVNSGDTVGYQIFTNMTSGYYEIISSSGDLFSNKKFYINEKAIVSFELMNQTLKVKNIGNIPYNKDIQVDLNGRPFVKRVDLELGEIKEYKLTGTNENYDIKVSDGESEMLQSGIPLTGRAVGVEEKTGISLINNPIIWIFLIIILIGFAIFYFRDVFKKKSFAYPWEREKVIELKGKETKKTSKIPEKQKEDKKHDRREFFSFPKVLNMPSKAEQSLISDGHRQRVAVVVIKIKNKLNKFAKESLEKAIEFVYEYKGAVYEQGNYITIIFSPLITRSFNNEITASKIARRISDELNEYNKKFTEKIDFGIGVNEGEIMNKIEDKKLKFTSLGNVMPVAKKIAEVSSGEVLLTKEIYEKAMSKIKAEKKKTNVGDVYELREVPDSDKNKKFINDFLKRQVKEEKRF